MSGKIQVKATPTSHDAVTASGILQRKCACGSHTIAGGACESCEKEKTSTNLQRTATNAEPVNEVPPIVHEVLRSSGQPLDAATRAFMEPRFDHDFSRVRVHTDAKAAKSARAVNALAYTVGHDVVFGGGAYAPGTMTGRRLLAHELTHVVQQGKSGAALATKLEVGSPHDSSEAEADTVAARVLAGERVSLASVMPARHLQRAIVNENAAGCGICEEAAESGKRAHKLTQDAFGVYPSVQTEVPIFYTQDEENGRLDLVRIIKSPTPPFKTLIEIGEIKPNNINGIKRGFKDLAFYKGQMEATQSALGVPTSNVQVGFMKIPAPTPPLAFTDPTSKCFGQAFFIEGPFDGLYTYSCAPPRSSFPKQSCCAGQKDPVREPVGDLKKEKKNKPVQSPATDRQPVPVLQPATIQEIMKFIRMVIETGIEVGKAVHEFLKQHPELADVLEVAAAAIFIANIVEDIVSFGVGLADEPAVIAICWALIEEASVMRAAALVPLAR